MLMWLRLQVVEQLGGGSLAPGLCQQLMVEFAGQQELHYQDTILMHTEVGTSSRMPQQQRNQPAVTAFVYQQCGGI